MVTHDPLCEWLFGNTEVFPHQVSFSTLFWFPFVAREDVDAPQIVEINTKC